MARVIKKSKSDQPENESDSVASVVRSSPVGGRVLEKEVFRAKLEAAELVKQGELDRKKRLADGKRKAAQAKEEAIAKGEEDAFREVALQVVALFLSRKKQYDALEHDVSILALEIAQKIFGGQLELAQDKVHRLAQDGLKKLRVRRRMRIQALKETMDGLKNSDRQVYETVKDEPELAFEDVTDIKPGFMRIVTDVCSVLCPKNAVVDALKTWVA